MLIVVANIEGYQIQRTIIWIGFISFNEHVVLSNKVATDRMKTKSQQGTSDQVEQAFWSEKVQDCQIERDL